MPHRHAEGWYIYHVFNRAIDGLTIFESPEDYAYFEGLMAAACLRVPMRTLAYSLMPNHWHFVLWPYEDGDLPEFMHWLTSMHAHKWREQRQNIGRGHVYQGPYKNFPTQGDDHLLRLCRYVERNAKTANLVQRAEDWRWCSLWRRLHPDVLVGPALMLEWPVHRPTDWIEMVNEPQTEAEVNAIRVSITRGRPLGAPDWQQRVAKALGIEPTLRSKGRPRKAQPSGPEKTSQAGFLAARPSPTEIQPG